LEKRPKGEGGCQLQENRDPKIRNKKKRRATSSKEKIQKKGGTAQGTKGTLLWETLAGGAVDLGKDGHEKKKKTSGGQNRANRTIPQHPQREKTATLKKTKRVTGQMGGSKLRREKLL